MANVYTGKEKWNVLCDYYNILTQNKVTVKHANVKEKNNDL